MQIFQLIAQFFFGRFFIAIVIARKIAGRYRLAKEDVLYGAIYAAIGILIGSKLLYCLTRLPSLIQKWDAVAAGFDKNFMQTLLFLMNYLFGGLVFYGGLIGAFWGSFVTVSSIIYPMFRIWMCLHH